MDEEAERSGEIVQPAFDHEWTADDVIVAQETSPYRIELLDGVLMTSPAPRLRHQRVSSTLSGRFEQAAADSGVAVMVFENVNVRRGERDLLQPDIAVVTRAAGIEGLEADEVAFAPEDVLLAVEILSPGHEGADRIDKLARYAEWAIASYWVVDPKALTVETHTLDGDEYAPSGTAKPGVVTTLPAFAPVALDPGTLLRMR
ncbi:Uma2 family endonuclease [Embleya sp. NBC_00888]|uniref:Uma2 family endonuclease n=1 Tax=Embleya sp. NBC_00888 TaxID=2975960 RepID=UPI00386F820A|nr:Uma2 family endonuclease [Embleya sp. NBC_00888]